MCIMHLSFRSARNTIFLLGGNKGTRMGLQGPGIFKVGGRGGGLQGLGVLNVEGDFWRWEGGSLE
jgi:hypothetical protein